MGSQPISAPPAPDARRILEALRWLVRELRLAQGSGERSDGLSAAQIFVLHVLKDQGPLGVGDLADHTATDPSSVSVVVRKLHQKGLVGKEADAGDRRRVRVTLTAAGLRAAGETPLPVQQLMLDRLAAMKPADVHTLADLLERLAPAAEDGHPAPMFFQEGAAAGRRR